MGRKGGISVECPIYYNCVSWGNERESRREGEGREGREGREEGKKSVSGREGRREGKRGVKGGEVKE